MAQVVAIQRESYLLGQRQQTGQIEAREHFAMPFRFHHVHIICKDLEKMIAFFTECLGADLARRKKFGTADGASLDLQGTTINLRAAMADVYRGWLEVHCSTYSPETCLWRQYTA